MVRLPPPPWCSPWHILSVQECYLPPSVCMVNCGPSSAKVNSPGSPLTLFFVLGLLPIYIRTTWEELETWSHQLSAISPFDFLFHFLIEAQFLVSSRLFENRATLYGDMKSPTVQTGNPVPTDSIHLKHKRDRQDSAHNDCSAFSTFIADPIQLLFQINLQRLRCHCMLFLRVHIIIISSLLCTRNNKNSCLHRF